MAKKGNRKESEHKLTERFAELMVRRIEEIQTDWKRPWVSTSYTGAPQNLSGRYYNGMNSMLLMLLRQEKEWKTPVFMTFKQAKDNGWNVNRGETGFPVYLWRPLIKDKDGHTLTQQEFDDLPQSEKDLCRTHPVGMVHIVFNAEQTSMPAVAPERFNELVDRFAPGRLLDDGGRMRSPELDYMLDNGTWLCPIHVQQSDEAFYSPSRDSITVPLKEQFPEAEKFYGTLLHEMAHSTGHETRLARDMNNRFGDEAYGVEELVAEMTAAVCAAQLGITKGIQDDNAQYLKHWLNHIKQDPDFIMNIMTEVNRATALVTRTVHTEQMLEAVKQQAMENIGSFIDSRKQQAEEAKASLPVYSGEELISSMTTIRSAQPGPALSTEVMQTVQRVKQDKGMECLAMILDGDRYMVTGEDARILHRLTGWQLQTGTLSDGQTTVCLSFPADKFADILPVAIRSGQQVAAATLQHTRTPDTLQVYAEHAAQLTYHNELYHYGEVGLYQLPGKQGYAVLGLDAETVHDVTGIGSRGDRTIVVAESQLEQCKLSLLNAGQPFHVYSHRDVQRIMDGEQVRQDKPDYSDPELETGQRTAEAVDAQDSARLAEFDRLKKKHPDTLLLFRSGDFYDVLGEDADKCSTLLGLDCRQDALGRSGLHQVSFPFAALDTYLPKLIRQGHRVAICDWLTSPQTKKTVADRTAEEPSVPKLHSAHLGNGISYWEEGDNSYTAHVSPQREVTFRKAFSPQNEERIRQMAEKGNLVVQGGLVLNPLNMADRCIIPPFGGPQAVSLELVDGNQVACCGRTVLKDTDYHNLQPLYMAQDALLMVRGVDEVRPALQMLFRAGVNLDVLDGKFEYFLDTLTDAEQLLKPYEKSLRDVCFRITDGRLTDIADSYDKLDAGRTLPEYYLDGNVVRYNAPAESRLKEASAERAVLAERQAAVLFNDPQSAEEVFDTLRRAGILHTHELDSAIRTHFSVRENLPESERRQGMMAVYLTNGVARDMQFDVNGIDIDEPVYTFNEQGRPQRFEQTAPSLQEGETETWPYIVYSFKEKEGQVVQGTGKFFGNDTAAAQKYYTAQMHLVPDDVNIIIQTEPQLYKQLEKADTLAEISGLLKAGQRFRMLDNSLHITNISDIDRLMAKKTTAENSEQVQNQQNEQKQQQQTPREGVHVFAIRPGIYGVNMVKDGQRGATAAISKEDRDLYFSEVKGKTGDEAEAVRKNLYDKYFDAQGEKIQKGNTAGQQTDKPNNERRFYPLAKASEEDRIRIGKISVFKMTDGKSYAVRAVIDGVQQTARKLSDNKTAAYFNGYKGLDKEQQTARQQDLVAAVYHDVFKAAKQEQSKGIGR